MSTFFKKIFNKKTLLRRVLPGFFAVCGAAAATAVILICAFQLDSQPELTFNPELPKMRLIGFMDSFCLGKYDDAEGYLLGNPDLGADNAPENAVGELIWNEFIASTSYTLIGDCYATDNGIGQKISYTYLDISSVTANLRARAETLLKERVESAENVSEIYDENNEYREDVVNEILLKAVKDAIVEDGKTITIEITVNLEYKNDQWWVKADQELLDSLFGDVLFYSY